MTKPESLFQFLKVALKYLGILRVGEAHSEFLNSNPNSINA
jgi:hypothetical protein